MELQPLGRPLLIHLDPWVTRFEGEVAIPSNEVGSLVIDGQEVVVAFATPAPAGGWLVLTTQACECYER
jgi:hypothetical protein